MRTFSSWVNASITDFAVNAAIPDTREENILKIEARLFTDSAFLDDLSSSVRYLAVEIHEECISRELVPHTLERLNFHC